jgi:UDP-glucose 4-epimerase
VRNRTVAVTGSRGFLGSEIAQTLRKSGYEVLELSRSTIDYSNVETLSDALMGIEILIHAGWAGISRNDRDNTVLQRINVDISKNLIEACKIARVVHFVGLGSQAEFGNQRAPFKDDQMTFPTTQYGLAKCTVEKLLQRSEIKFTWARIFSAYGEGDSRDWIFTKAVDAIIMGKILTVGPCSQLWGFTHKTDIALGIKWIIDNNIQGAVNLSTTENGTLRSYLEKLQYLAGESHLINFSQELSAQNDIYPCEGKLYASGWRPRVSIDEGFIRCLKGTGKSSQ